MSKGIDNPLKLNYKLKDNPFIASDLVPPTGNAPTAESEVIVARERASNPRPLFATPTAQPIPVPTSTEPKKHVRASVMRMAASNTVSSNPWKTKLNSMMDPILPPLSKRNHPKDEPRTNDDLAVSGSQQEGGGGPATIVIMNEAEGGPDPDLAVVEAETAPSPPQLSLALPEVVPSDTKDDTPDQVAEQQTQTQKEAPLLSIAHDTEVPQVGATETDSPIVAPAMEPQKCNHDIAGQTSSSAMLVETEDDQGFLHIDSDNADSDDDDDDEDTAGLATPDDSSVSEDDNDRDSRHCSAATELTMIDSLHSPLSDSKAQSPFISVHPSSCLDSVITEEPASPLLIPPPPPASAIEREGSGGTPFPGTNPVLQQRTVTQDATHFPAYGLLDAQKWLDASAQARCSVGYLHDRLKVETHAQRAIAAVLKLKAEKRDRALASDLQAHATAIDTMVDALVSAMALATPGCDASDDVRVRPGTCPIPETILGRLRALAGVKEPMDLEALVSRLEQQQQRKVMDQVWRDDAIVTDQDDLSLSSRLKETEAAFKAAQQEYTRREAALMLQSASVEAELASAVKEYERVTRNIADFNNERKTYDAEIAKLTRERHMLEKQVVDAKVEWQIGRDGQSMSLRKEFRQLMAAVKDEHMDAIQKEIDQRKAVEDALRSLRHEFEVKRWDRVDTGVQTHFVYTTH